MPDPLDQHDFEQLLQEFGRRPSLAYERLEHFFRVEIPERERRRALTPSTRPQPGDLMTGFPAIGYAERNGLTLCKYADPIEDARVGLTVSEAKEVAREDPSLIYLVVPTVAAEAARPAAGKKAKKAAAKRRAWPRVAALTAVFMTACGGADDMSIVGDDQVDADAGELGDGGADIDADPDAPDAALPDAETGGLPNGAACDPRAAECAGGLTCRVTSLEPVGGTCRPSGTALENDVCDLDNGDGDCGPAMACLGTADPRCYVICDRADPEPRCGVADPCIAVFGPDVEIGACSP